MAHAPNMPVPRPLARRLKNRSHRFRQRRRRQNHRRRQPGHCALALGQRVGLIDADIYGPNVPLMMGSAQQPAVGPGNQIIPNLTHGIKTISIGYISPGDKPLVMRGPMLHQIIRQFLQQVEWGELDYLIVDLPPGTGDVVISLVQTVPLTGAVVVSTPSDVSLQDARKALEMFAQVNVEVLGIVENMSHFTCPHCHQEIDIFSKGGAERTAQQFNIPFLGSDRADPFHPRRRRPRTPRRARRPQEPAGRRVLWNRREADAPRRSRRSQRHRRHRDQLA
jgi:ATP-binding protein involved in chromosome partitioning